jgi:hypothetical protein
MYCRRCGVLADDRDLHVGDIGVGVSHAAGLAIIHVAVGIDGKRC